MDRYLYLLNYFNIVNSSFNQKNEKYARNIREANELIMSNYLNDSEIKTLLSAMGDFLYSSNMSGEYLIKEDALKGNQQLNYGQREFLEAILSDANYSFSMTTSFGKSFLAKKMVKNIIKQEKRVLFIVPTLALMYEYFSSLKELKPSTQNDNSAIHILTQERALFYDFKEKDYVIFDEAYEAFEDEERSVLTSKIIIKAIKNNSIVKMLSPNLLDPLDIIPVSIKKHFLSFVLNHTLTSRNIVKRTNVKEFIKEISNNSDNWICYCKKSKMYEMANEFINNGQNINGVKNCLIDGFLTQEYSEDFLLIKFLKSGIAVHNGDIPKDIRFISELLFKSGHLKKMIANTTLVQGVNLKANNLAIFSTGTSGNFTNFMIRNLIGRVGRYDQNKLFLRHGKVFIIESAGINLEAFEEINDSNLLAYDNASKKNEKIEEIKNNDSDFNNNAKEPKDILDYYFKDKNVIIQWVKSHANFFSKEKNYLIEKNLDLISEILKIILENLLIIPRNANDFFENFKLKTFSIMKIKNVLIKIIKKNKPYLEVIRALKWFKDTSPYEFLIDKVLKGKKIDYFNLFKKENKDIFNIVVLSRVIKESSKRNFVTDFLLTKLKIVITNVLKKEIDFDDKEKKVIKEMNNLGISEVFYDSYSDMKQEYKDEIKKLSSI